MALQEAIGEAQFSTLPSSPTVSGGFQDVPLRENQLAAGDDQYGVITRLTTVVYMLF
jgi:hypothetical protein